MTCEWYSYIDHLMITVLTLVQCPCFAQTVDLKENHPLGGTCANKQPTLASDCKLPFSGCKQVREMEIRNSQDVEQGILLKKRGNRCR